MASLDEWFDIARGIRAFYLSPDGLQREPGDFDVPEMANWLYHWREEGYDLATITQLIRNDPGGEWRAKHPGADPSPSSPPPAVVVPAPALPTQPVVPLPDVGGGVRVLPVTSASDGEFVNRGYSCYPAAFILGARAFVFAGHPNGPPSFFEIDLATNVVTPRGPLVGFTGTGENWYWGKDGWVYLIDGSRLMRVSPFANGETQVVFDISDDPQFADCDLWQPCSSDDGQVHSATVRRIVQEGKYPYIGTVVQYRGTKLYFPAVGTLDESQIDATGTILVIKETLEDGLSNRVINLSTRNTQVLRHRDGAVGHSDVGPYLLVGEWFTVPGDDWQGQIVKWDLNAPLTPGRRISLLPTWNGGHLSMRAGKCLRTSETHLSLLSLNGGGEVQLVAHGGEVGPGDAYDYQVFGSLDHTARLATYMVYQGGRFDLKLAVLPA